MVFNEVNSIFLINKEKDAHIVEGAGQEVVSSILKSYPLVKKGEVNIVVLKGFMINGNFSQFHPENYAKHRGRA